jgi:hypothetical protein
MQFELAEPDSNLIPDTALEYSHLEKKKFQELT